MSLVRRAVRSTRVHYGVLASATSSVAGLALTITQAHTVSLSDFAAFAVATALYALLIGTNRAAIAQPALAVPRCRDEVGPAVARSTLVGLLAGAVLLAVGLLDGLPYLTAVAIALPGLLVYDTVRSFWLAIIAPRRAFGQDLCWAAGTAALCALALTGRIPGYWAYAGWAILGAMIGFATAALAHHSCWPGWSGSKVPTRTTLAFGADYIVGSGAATVTTSLLAMFAGGAVVAAIRGAGTLYGPISLVIGVLPTLLIPSLRSMHDSSPAPIRAAVRLTAVITIAASGPLALIALFPPSWGQFVLGDVWSITQPLVPLLAIDSLTSLLQMVPLTGHRALLAGRASLMVRLLLAATRTACVVWAGVAYGAVAAAAAIAATSVVAAGAWWISYGRILRRRSDTNHSANELA